GESAAQPQALLGEFDDLRLGVALLEGAGSGLGEDELVLPAVDLDERPPGGGVEAPRGEFVAVFGVGAQRGDDRAEGQSGEGEERDLPQQEVDAGEAREAPEGRGGGEDADDGGGAQPPEGAEEVVHRASSTPSCRLRPVSAERARSRSASPTSCGE